MSPLRVLHGKELQFYSARECQVSKANSSLEPDANRSIGGLFCGKIVTWRFDRQIERITVDGFIART